jgi:hypothetical protein
VVRRDAMLDQVRQALADLGATTPFAPHVAATRH